MRQSHLLTVLGRRWSLAPFTRLSFVVWLKAPSTSRIYVKNSRLAKTNPVFFIPFFTKVTASARYPPIYLLIWVLSIVQGVSC